METPKTFCQSCCMPIDDISLRGSEKDGSTSEEYCKYCYADGAFAQDCTLQEMIDFCVPLMANDESGMDEAEARTLLNQTLPGLKRWAG